MTTAKRDGFVFADPVCRLGRLTIRLWVWLAAALVIPNLVLSRQSQPRNPDDVTISVRSQLVQVYFTVSEGDRRIMGLKAPDFKLVEDGKPVQFDRLDSQTVPLQIALLFDLSESMRDSLAVTQEAAVSFVDALDAGDRVTLVFFNSEIHCVPQLTEDRDPILHAIRSSRPQGGTRLYEALLYAMKYLDGKGKEGRKAIVCFSDGEDTSGTSSLKVVTTAAAQCGFPVYTIGAGAGLTRPGLRNILRQLADVNSGKTFLVKDPKKLQSAFAAVASELHSAYVLNYYTQVPSDGKWHDLDIRVANPVYRVHARPGFYARSAGMSALVADRAPGTKRRSSSPLRVSNDATREAARSAESEILVQQEPARPLDLRTVVSSGTTASTPGVPVFKVESRFVEVPVLVESATSKDLPPLEARDFRVYEDDSLREIAFFTAKAQDQGLDALRDSALKSVKTASGVSLAARTDDELLLGRYLLILDDTMSETGAFLRGKQAAETIIRNYNSGVRPLGLQFTSQAETNMTARESTETMLSRLHHANQHASRDLTTNDGIMSVYEAFLIDRGDKEAAELAELRLASSLRQTYRNELGEVYGEQPADSVMIQREVESTSRTLVTENLAQTTRTIEGLRMAVDTLSSYPGNYPRVIIFISNGFLLGRESYRGDAGQLMSEVVAAAKRHGIRIFSIDCGGLAVQESLGIGADGSFLIQNPSAERVLQTHASAWQFEKESSLSQPAVETGGRFLHNTNDLTGAVAAVMRSTGQLYYLGYLSKQPADAKFHRIRVATSLGSKVRIHTRPGYFADSRSDTADSAKLDAEPVAVLLARVDEARKTGNIELLAGSLEKLSSKFPNQPEVWFNLGSVEMALNHPLRAVKAFQRAFVHAPEDREISVQLSRALLAAGDPDAAADTLERVTQRGPADARILIQLGRMYEAGSRVPEAHQTYRRILDLTLTPPLEVYLLLARTAIGLERPVEADLFIRDYLGRGGDAASVQHLRTVEQASRRRDE